MQFVNTLKEGDRVSSVYHVKNKSQGSTKAGKEYFSIQLQDKTGMIDGKIWDINSVGIDEFKIADYVDIDAEVIAYNNQLQMKITKLKVVDVKDVNTEDYFAVSKYDPNDMYKELTSLISKVKNKNYSKLLNEFFVNDEKFKNKFMKHQGAKVVHHSFISGLIEHTLNTTKLAIKIAENYNDINVDLVITSAILHDIAKMDEISSYPENEYTDKGQLIGHIVLGYEKIKDKINAIGGFSEKETTELLHCILSHHGSTEFGSPKLPMLMEAYVVSQADNTDAKLQIMRETIANAKLTNKMDTNGFVGNNKFIGTNLRESKINQ